MKDPIQQWFLKIAKVLFLTVLALSLIGDVLRSVTTMQLVVTSAVISLVAYLIRQRRLGPARRPRSTSTGERTPVMPRSDR